MFWIIDNFSGTADLAHEISAIVHVFAKNVDNVIY